MRLNRLRGKTERQTGTRNGYPVMEGTAARGARSRRSGSTIPTDSKGGFLSRFRRDNGPTLI